MAADTDQNGSVTFGEFKKDLLDLLDLLFGFVSEADDGDGAARENGDCRDHSERHGGGDGGRTRRSRACKDSAAWQTQPFREHGAKPSLLDLSDVSDMTADEFSGGGWGGRTTGTMVGLLEEQRDLSSSGSGGGGNGGGGGSGDDGGEIVAPTSSEGSGSGGSPRGGRWRACTCANSRQDLLSAPWAELSEGVPPIDAAAGRA